MKKTPCLSLALFVLLLPLAVLADDVTPPTVTWNAPGEGTCWQIDATHPELGLVISAEDPSGVKQGQIWRKKGRYDLTADFRSWPSLWGHTYARDGVAPPAVRETLLFRMMGFDEGMYTFIAEFADMARHNSRRAVLHVSIDHAPPTVSITSPASGGVVCRDKNLAIAVSASDGGCGVAQVQLYLNEVTSTTPVSVDTTRPFQLTVPKELLRVDSLRIIVRAIDRAGRSSLAEITVRPTLYCLMRGTVRR
jgi:hypothetical protein